MFIWIVQFTILSILFIFLVHHLIEFFKETLTVPKIKDLVNTPMRNYDNIYHLISQDKNKDKGNPDLTTSTEIDFLPSCQDPSSSSSSSFMKNELKTFLKSQMKSSSTKVEDLGTSSSPAYYDFK